MEFCKNEGLVLLADEVTRMLNLSTIRFVGCSSFCVGYDKFSGALLKYGSLNIILTEYRMLDLCAVESLTLSSLLPRFLINVSKIYRYTRKTFTFLTSSFTHLRKFPGLWGMVRKISPWYLFSLFLKVNFPIYHLIMCSMPL